MENIEPASPIRPSSSRILIVILIAIIILLAVVCFIFARKKSTTQATTTPSPSQMLATTSPTISTTSDDIVSAYSQAPFRVIGYIYNPKDHYYLVVATERDDGGNDSACGSIYTSRTCYFFIERAYYADAPSRKFVAKLERAGMLGIETITFNKNIINFETGDGDGGHGFSTKWQLNITTGEFKELETSSFSQ